MVTVMPEGAVRKRFLFDTSEKEAEAQQALAEPAEPTITMSEHAALLRQAEEQAFERGRAEAITGMEAQEEGRRTAIAQDIAVALKDLIERVEQVSKEQEKGAVALCFLIARRLCAHLVAREPLGEVVALMNECLKPLRRVPTISIEVPEQDAPALEKMLGEIAGVNGYTGRIHVSGKPGLMRGDCRIEWPEGGIIRDRRKTNEHIEGVLQAYFKAADRENAAPKGNGHAEQMEKSAS
ncbi:MULTISPECIES: FliH/SctL family protein [Pseudovibrio]|uniref:FliH/SctL family protein n=1 Tax=Stappiaceae TaxID=2821832 RepID=UPI0023673959|nr:MULTISPECIES: FliH/SctL family protein [Pseudovibrio]MDD7910149.1 FliH/SctL family protein [Pseudovibrio exalbescens]MDX5595339.1 FliH/SctL family protein [Pseudovibrio sp. SPO723]